MTPSGGRIKLIRIMRGEEALTEYVNPFVFSERLSFRLAASPEAVGVQPSYEFECRQVRGQDREFFRLGPVDSTQAQFYGGDRHWCR